MNPRRKTRVLVPLGTPRKLGVPRRVLLFVLSVIYFGLRPVFLVIGKVYKLCFGSLDAKLGAKNARERQQKFAEEIEGQLAFLFDSFRGKIVPNDSEMPFPPPMDGAYVTVETGKLRFQFCRGRGDFSVKVAALSAPAEWEDIGLVLATIPNLDFKVEQQDLYQLHSFAKILPEVLEPLGLVLSTENSASTLDQAAHIHNERAEEYVSALKQSGIIPKVHR